LQDLLNVSVRPHVFFAEDSYHLRRGVERISRKWGSGLQS
jgi:hypothetical protein